MKTNYTNLKASVKELVKLNESIHGDKESLYDLVKDLTARADNSQSDDMEKGTYKQIDTYYPSALSDLKKFYSNK